MALVYFGAESMGMWTEAKQKSWTHKNRTNFNNLCPPRASCRRYTRLSTVAWEIRPTESHLRMAAFLWEPAGRYEQIIPTVFDGWHAWWQPVKTGRHFCPRQPLCILAMCNVWWWSWTKGTTANFHPRNVSDCYASDRKGVFLFLLPFSFCSFDQFPLTCRCVQLPIKDSRQKGDVWGPSLFSLCSRALCPDVLTDMWWEFWRVKVSWCAPHIPLQTVYTLLVSLVFHLCHSHNVFWPTFVDSIARHFGSLS